jgi:hypothetical protein
VAVQDLGIYFPESSAGIFRYHFRQIAGRASDDWSYYISPDPFNQSAHEKKIACFQIPYPYTSDIESQIDSVYDSANAVVVLGSELHRRTVDFIRKFDRPKMWWFLCGCLNPRLLNGHTYQFLDWFTTTIHFYKNVRPTTLYDLRPYDKKPLMFDALLGRKKHHRDRAFNFIHEHGLNTQGIVTYINQHDIDFQTTNESQWLWEDTGLEGHKDVQWTVEPVNYYGYRMSLSQVMPLNIYNQTAYSLVCETNSENDSVFFTEKTVKPILARRLFVMVANRYSLAMLRELGFRTFGNIIDESYDEMADEVQRQYAALEQLKWLCAQPQERILAQCQDIVDHNFNLMYGRDWYHDFGGPLSRALFD